MQGDSDEFRAGRHRFFVRSRPFGRCRNFLRQHPQRLTPFRLVHVLLRKGMLVRWVAPAYDLEQTSLRSMSGEKFLKLLMLKTERPSRILESLEDVVLCEFVPHRRRIRLRPDLSSALQREANGIYDHASIWFSNFDLVLLGHRH